VPTILNNVNLADNVRPAVASIRDAEKWLGISRSTLKRIAEIEPTFPRLICISYKVVLFDVEACSRWLIARAGRAPVVAGAESIRDNAVAARQARTRAGAVAQK
jgi:predicted DNA-binding transcriptional regulator AlpA